MEAKVNPMREETYANRGAGASDLLLSFLLGGLAGAAVAILYAPRPGLETRERLKEGIARSTERGKELKERVVDRGRGLIQDASQYVDKGRERISAAVEAGREAYRQEKDTLAAPAAYGGGSQGAL
jgi:gas vesicle protein